MPKIGIYEIKNNLNGLVYIGQTNDWERRVSEHKRRYNNKTPKSERSYLYRAIRKYGLENFSFFLIKECSIEELNDLEIRYIKEKDSFYNGYNMTEGGQNDHPNRKVTLEDVIYLRKLYDSQTTLTNKEIWEEKFKDKITYQYFRNLWQGTNWSYVMPEVFTEENKNYYRHKSITPGKKTNKFSDEEVIQIRKENKKIGVSQLYQKYGKSRVSFSAFEKMLRGPNYGHIPSREKLWEEGSN